MEWSARSSVGVLWSMNLHMRSVSSWQLCRKEAIVKAGNFIGDGLQERTALLRHGVSSRLIVVNDVCLTPSERDES